MEVAETRRSRTIAAEAQAIWDVLADFGAISSWADFAEHSCLLSPAAEGVGVGTTRRVQVGRDALVERITDFDPPHTLAYDVQGLPRQLRRLNSRWTLRPDHRLHRGHPDHDHRDRVRTGCSGSPNGALAASPPNNSTRCSPDSPTEWKAPMSDRPDIVIVMTDEERAIPPYESPTPSWPGGSAP